MVAPNEKQGELIENTDGIYVVDAGAGTGKTFAISRRYAKIIESGVEPGDILLATFTNNAAEQMKERIMQLTDMKASKLYDAPISTFHAFSKRILKEHGFDAPGILGIEDSIPESLNVMESKIREQQEFQMFIDQFVEEHPEYSDYYRILDDYTELLNLVKNLASKGVIPEKDGWFQDTEKYLDGDFEEFKRMFKKANRPRETENGRKQSELRDRLYSMKWKNFTDDAPDLEDIRGDRGTKQVRRDFARKAFNEDREELKQFVHDLYYSYMEYSLSRNYLNFNLLMVFAYVLLFEDDSLRRELEFEYVMIDEFQDTNEIQFKLALLLAGEPNLCVVGDWKQSIYSFQYASVENIQFFRNRLEKYAEELGRKRVGFDVENRAVEQINLVKNYRSTQEILDLAESSLTLPATERDHPDPSIEKKITSLESTRDTGSMIEKYSCRDEVENVLAKIQDVVDNPDYTVGEEKSSYGDIAVLTRTRSFGIELQKKAADYGIPVAYEGGVELFKTRPAILLLAWLRVINSDADRGWAVVLEEAGYTLDEAEHILETGDYPDNMLEFREKLAERENIGAVSREVFTRYGINNGFTDKIIEVLENTFRGSYMNLGGLIQFVEDNIDAGEIYEVDNSQREDVVKIQTIHAAKGLEYPIVFLADVNQNRFPSTTSGSTSIEYEDPIGLRTRKIYDDSSYAYSYDNWRSEILFRCLSGEYDEERRLLYVAITRAEDHLIVTGEAGRESSFFEHLDIEARPLESEPDEIVDQTGGERRFEAGPVSGKRPVKRSVHSIMEGEFDADMERGRSVHAFAESLVRGEDVKPEIEDEENLAAFLETLEGEMLPEKTLLLPLNSSRKIVFEGRPDLIVKRSDSIDVIDFKTDRERRDEEYRLQLSFYYHALEQLYPDREIRSILFYSYEGTAVALEPLERSEMETLILEKI
ncbi:MAG: UvrD-helicase domain-containing protein [Candidatus Nanohaloarchaea archaeon]